MERQQKMQYLIHTLIFVAVMLAGCAPDRPDTEYHRNATNKDCVICHLGDAGPGPPSDHLEDGEIKSSREDCKGCHELE